MHRFKLIVILIVFVLVVGLAIGWFGYLGGDPASSIISSVNEDGPKLSATGVYRITFNRPVSRKSLQLIFDPNVDGEITFEKPLYGKHFFSQVSFKPIYGWLPGKRYSVTIRGIKNAIGGDIQEDKILLFNIEDPPEVIDMNFNGDDDNLSINPTVTVTLNRPRDATNLFFETEPAVDWDVSVDEEGKVFTLKPTRPLDHDVTYGLSAFGTVAINDVDNTTVYQGNRWLMYKRSFHTRAPYSVKSWSPTGHSVDLTTPISIDFGAPIDLNELRDNTIFRLTPDVPGEFQWNDDFSLVRFIPEENWSADTFYSVELGRDLCFTAGNTGSRLECKFAFRTLGPVKISSVYPKNGMAGVDVETNISVTFNQEVDKVSAQESFKLTPSVPGKFTWEDSSLTFNPDSPLAHDTEYKIIVETGVKGFVGEPLSRRVEVPFVTQGSTTQMEIALDYQDRSLSCEAAVLKMALSHYGTTVTENEIMELVGYDPTPHRGDVWGNPYLAYVGNIDGKQNTTGYGVYWEPIAAAAKNWKSASEYFTGGTLEKTLEEVAAGHPVIAWGVYPGGTRDSWTTPEGIEIKAWKGEHTRLVVGFTGTIKNPTRIIVLDPYAGKQFWDPDDFMLNWSAFDMSGVVVK